MTSNLRAVVLAAVAGLVIGGGAFALSRGGGDGGAVAPSAPAASLLPSSLGTQPASSLPPESVAEQGGKYYAVFLALAREEGAEALSRAHAQAARLGYNGGVGDIECTAGARTQLRLPATGTYTAYSVFFDSRERADRFVQAYGQKVIGTAYITAGCLD
jgi:hypothetical protein